MPVEEMIPVEVLIDELHKVRREIKESEQRRDELEEAIIKANSKQWDMITVQFAATKSGLSVPTIYRFINNGKLKKVEYKGGRKYVSESEIMTLNDKYKG